MTGINMNGKSKGGMRKVSLGMGYRTRELTEKDVVELEAAIMRGTLTEDDKNVVTDIFSFFRSGRTPQWHK